MQFGHVSSAFIAAYLLLVMGVKVVKMGPPDANSDSDLRFNASFVPMNSFIRSFIHSSSAS